MKPVKGQLTMLFKPKFDITAYEVAKILESIQLGVSVDSDAWKNLGPLQRHWAANQDDQA